MADESPKIYVADLAAYNKGSLVGDWIDLSDYDSGSEVMEKIQEMVDEWKEADPSHEEYAIHDKENIPDSLYNESMGEKEFDEIIEAWKVAEDRNIPFPVLAEWMSDHGASADNGSDAFYGEYDDEEDFAYRLVEEGVITDLSRYLSMTDTDRRILAGEEADNYIENLDDSDMDRIMRDADLEEEFNEIDEKQDRKEELEQELEDAKELLENEEDEDEPDTANIDKLNDQIEELEKTLSREGLNKFDVDDAKNDLFEEAKEKVRDEHYEQVYESLSDPVEYFVHEQGLYTEEELAKQSFVMVDYKDLADDLKQDHSFIEHDGKVYVFTDNYAKGGPVKKEKPVERLMPYYEFLKRIESLKAKHGDYGVAKGHNSTSPLYTLHTLKEFTPISAMKTGRVVSIDFGPKYLADKKVIRQPHLTFSDEAKANSYYNIVKDMMPEAKKMEKGGKAEDDFVVHGTYTVSNSGGYEIMLDRSGESAKVRDAFGSDNPQTSGWLPIEYVEDKDTGEAEPVIDPKGYNIPLSHVMRRSYAKGGLAHSKYAWGGEPISSGDVTQPVYADGGNTGVKYASIVFMQGDEAEEPLKILDEKGGDAVIDYLSEWDNGEYYDISDTTGAGSSDRTVKKGDYIVSYNTSIGYIGLSKKLKEGEYKKGGRITFDDKVKAISKKLQGHKVDKKYHKDYGKVYDKKEAKIAATKIAGSIVQKERRKKK